MSETYHVYRPSVRIGNWYEDICLEEDEIKIFLKKREKTELLIQKTRMLFINFHKKIDVDESSDIIKFGSIVNIISRMQACAHIIKRPALSVVVNEQVVRKSLQVNELCELTVAPSTTPCVRNSFRITSCEGNVKDGDPVRYGQDFRIECVEAAEQPLYLFSMQKSADLSTVAKPTFDSYKRGEINIPVALCLEKQMGPGKDIPVGFIKWRCLHPKPEMRFETDGQPVPFNVPVVINHSVTNRHLATENIIVQTLFGPEFLVSVQNYLDTFKRENPKNIWVISNCKDNNVKTKS